MPVTVNYTDAPKQKTFEPLPPADYVVTVQKSEVDDPDEPTHIALRLKVQEGEFTGRVIFDRLYLTPASAWRHNQFRAAIGMDQITGQEEIFEEDYVGETLIVSVETNTHKGKVGNRVKLFTPVGGSEEASGRAHLPWETSL